MRNPTLLAVLLAAGCGIAVTSTGISPPQHAMVSRPVESVEVFASGPPTRPHVDIALITASDRGGHPDGVGGILLDQLRNRAAGMGCDAIALVGVTGRDKVEGMVAACVAYTDQATAQR